MGFELENEIIIKISKHLFIHTIFDFYSYSKLFLKNNSIVFIKIIYST